jgi:hypothetical protein
VVCSISINKQKGYNVKDKGVEKTNDSDSPTKKEWVGWKQKEVDEQKQPVLEGQVHAL